MKTTLRCPICTDTPAGTEDYGILSCRCGDYPVVAGIPIIQRDRKILDMVEKGRHREALLSALRPDISMPDYLQRGFLRRARKYVKHWKTRQWYRVADKAIDGDSTANDFFRLYFDREDQDALNYFLYRFTQPRHLVGLSLSTLFRRGPILDLGCGFGHVTRGIKQPVIATDVVFFLLYVAQRFIADAEYVCCDANNNLPFTDNTFAGVMSTNMFHFIANQTRCFRELRRVTDGPLILASLRHTGQKNHVPNHARSVAGYRELAGNCRIVTDEAILRRYLEKQGPDLSTDSENPEDAALISMIVSDDDTLFRRHGTFDEWPHDGYRLNPLYRDEGDSYRLHMPPGKYREDNSLMTYLPETIAKTDTALVDRMVMIDVPDKYIGNQEYGQSPGVFTIRQA